MYQLTTGSTIRRTGVRPNNAFKPKPLRSANHMAGTACHVLRSTTRLGLTWVLGLVSRTVGAKVQADSASRSSIAFAPRTRGERRRRSALTHLGFGQARLSARLDRPSRLRTERSESSWPREPLVLASAPASASPRPFGQTCCTVRRRGWAVLRSGASSACGGLTSRSSRSRFVTQTTWQVELAMCFAPLRVSA